MSDEENEEHNTIFLKAPIVEAPPDEAPTSSGKLVCLDTSLVNAVPDGNEYWFESGEQSIGRGEECTVRIDSSEVSRVHARVTTYSDRWVIEDVESRNGTRVNDERIAGKTVLAPGDMVHFGQVPFRFDVIDLLEQALDEDAEADVAIAIDFPEPPPPPAPTAEVEEEITLELPGEVPEPAAAAAASEPAPVSVPEPAPAPAAVEGDPDTDPGLALDEAPAPAEMPAVAPAPSAAPLAATAPPAALPRADVAMLREHVPQLVSLLLEHARGGDSAAARVCLEFLVHEEQRLPKDLGSTGAMGQLVKQILASMTQGDLPPRQALDALQAIATARDLLGRPTGKSS